MRLADAFRAQVIDASTEHFVFEITGKQSKIEQFIALMQPLGLVEVSRTGLAAISRGARADVATSCKVAGSGVTNAAELAVISGQGTDVCASITIGMPISI